MKFISLLLLAAELVSLHAPVSAQQTFSDIENSWYKPLIQELAEDNSITGYPDGTFKPKTVINRAEFLTLLLRSQAENEPIVGEPCFPDVKADAWYARWVCAAARRKVVGGYPDGNFRPEEPVNIAEAHAMVLRLINAGIAEQQGENWYKPYSDFLHKQEILSKYNYIAWEPLLRERAADLIYKLNTYKDRNGSSRESPGCGKPEPRGEINSVTVRGEQRTFILELPRNYENRKPVPLLMAYHGRTNDAQQVKQYYNFDRTMGDYIIVYPQALENTNGSHTYSKPGEKPSEYSDVLLFDEIVHTISNQYCVDMFRIYAAGHSLGGWFANTLGCVRGDVLRATASVGSSTTVTNCSGPAAGIFIQNPKDNLSSLSSGLVARDHRMQENMCDNVWQQTGPTSLHCEQVSCMDGNPVKWCPHTQDTDHRGAYYPHVWPDGAENAIKEFFEGLPD